MSKRIAARLVRNGFHAVAVAMALSIGACGGGGGGGGASGNRAPTVSAGDDQTVEQNTVVTLTGVASDDGGAAGLTFAWRQRLGPPVSLSGEATATATFSAPSVVTPEVLEFVLTVTDADGASASDVVAVTVVDDLAVVILSGVILYEFVPAVGAALDYAGTVRRPARGVTVQLVDVATNSVLESTTSDASGAYSFPVEANRNAFVRARAELKRAGPGGWDVEVRNNTAQTQLALDRRPLYVLDSGPFNTGVGLRTVSLLAETGWTGLSYGEPRAAAPFAILDVIYNAMQLVAAQDPDAAFPALDVYWSVNNRPSVGVRNPDTGDIGSSFYRRSVSGLFLLGAEDTDTEEFDTHVIAHEWGHYFEDKFSRSDSIGGPHSLSERLDPRLAFGEGFGNAISAMINDDPVYVDTLGARQARGFQFNLESPGGSTTTRGWYNERSIQSILYDLFDPAGETGDDVALGFGPLYQVLVNEQREREAFTTIFSFITALKARNPAAGGDIDALVSAQAIDAAGIDWYGGGETNDAGRGDLALPVYTEVIIGGGPVNVCSTRVFDGDGDGNKLSVRRFLRFDNPATGTYTVQITTTNPPASGRAADPDMFVFDGGTVPVAGGSSGAPNVETFQMSSLPAGEYVAEIYEYSYLNVDSDTGSPVAQQDTCFDVRIDAN